MNKITWGGLLLLALLSGCSKPSSNDKLVVLKKMDVFETCENDSLKVIFSLTPGDECFIGTRKVEKMFAYLEVTCPEKGHGWVVIGDNYEIVNKK